MKIKKGQRAMVRLPFTPKKSLEPQCEENENIGEKSDAHDPLTCIYIDPVEGHRDNCHRKIYVNCKYGIDFE